MFQIYLILDNIRSLYNVGSIFRLAEGAGVSKIFLCGMTGVEKIGERVFLHPKLKKTALSGFDSVNWEYCDTTLEAIEKCKKERISVVAIELTSQSQHYLEYQYKQPLALLVGHETEGVTDEILSQADGVVEIPMRGQGKSMNVATSLAVVLFEALRQNR